MIEFENKIFDSIIVGSGPAGVSVAWPLVKAGKQILMLDVGNESSQNFILKNNKNISSSPKIRAPEFSYVFKDFNERYKIQSIQSKTDNNLAFKRIS